MLHVLLGRHYRIYHLLFPILAPLNRGQTGSEVLVSLRIERAFIYGGILLAKRTDGNYALPAYDTQ